MKPLILGDGLLGTEIRKQTGWDYLSRKKDKFYFGDTRFYRLLTQRFEEDYDVVVNCIGYTKTYDTNKEPCRSINYIEVSDLADVCSYWGVKLVHISTDYIRSYTECDPPEIPSYWYTYYKALADECVMRNPDNLIARCSFKPRPFPWDRAWVDLRGNFDYVDIIASLIIKLIEREATGLFNVGTGVKTMYELAKQTRPDVIPDFHGDEPHNIIMSVDKLNNFLR